MKYRYEVQLAALLHDIGKFYHKAGTMTEEIGGLQMMKNKYSHPEISAQFIEKHRRLFDKASLDTDAIKEMVLRHHANNYGDKEKFIVQDASEEYISYCNIIHIADGLSSSGDREGKGTRSPYRPLASVFGTLGNKKINIKMSADKLLPYECKSEEDRQKVDTNEDRKKAAVKMLDAFNKDMSALYNLEALTGSILVKKIKELLYKYTRFVNPATNTEYPDASLYDHSVTTCAIASCIHRNLMSKQGENFKYTNIGDKPTDISVVKVSLDGVSEFLVNNHINEDVTELTVGRFLVCKELITGVANTIISALMLPTVNILAKSDDTFYVMVPQCDLNKVIGIIKSNNDGLIEKDSSLKFTWTVVKSWRFEHCSFDDNIKLGETHSGDVEYFIKNGKWELDKFVSNHEVTNKSHRCKYCGSLVEGSNICSACKNALDFAKDVDVNGDYGMIYAVAPEFNKVLSDGFKEDSMYESSVSRISTYLRLMEEFFGVETYGILNKYKGAKVLHESMNGIYIICGIKDIPYIERDLYNKYREYTSEVYSLKFASSEFKQNTRNVHTIQYINRRMDKLLSQGDKISFTIGGITGSITALEYYIRVLERVIKFNNVKGKDASGLTYKLIECLQMYIEFVKTKDVSKLMCLPYLNHELDKIIRNKDKNLDIKKELIEDVMKVIEDGMQDISNPKKAQAEIWVDALKKGLQRDKEEV